MEKLNNYLIGEYIKEKKQLESVDKIIKKAIPMYKSYCSEYGWSYELNSAPKKYSSSTTGMITFSMMILMGDNFDLIVDEKCNNYFDKFYKEGKNAYEEILNNAIKLIKDNYEITNSEKKDKGFLSNTYGDNDPFTLTWCNYILSNMDKVNIDIKDIEFFRNDIYDECKNKVESIFNDIYHNNKKVNYSGKEGGGGKGPIVQTHIFPLLKVVQLYMMIKDTVSLEARYIDTVKSALENRLHYHLSLASIANSNFDAAELVFSLEGMLLLDSNRENFDNDLLDRVFTVIKDRQAISMYWRPLKPFVIGESGLALLPLSVEIAMSLIRTCRLLGTKGEKLFSKNYWIFSNYTDWIKARINKCNSSNNQEYFGWCSEHIYQSDIIHTWETSQVLVYLANFNDMTQKHIAYQSLTHANFSIKDFIKNENAWEEFEANEPFNYEEFKIYEQIGTHYLKSKDFHSMLLYGPPGTGKSTIAAKIAEAIGWSLITITPSDFIASGTDQVEAKAKNIFKVLEEQKNLVVLFDEIDRLILDRDSDYYAEQGDIFQFMTPSMLVKLKELREKKNIIFIIATNYEERIDKAIKRTGRVDEKYLVLPPDKVRREKIFIGRINREINVEKLEKTVDIKKLEVLEKLKELNTAKLIDKTSLFSFVEFKQLLDELFKKLFVDSEPNVNGAFSLIEDKFNNTIDEIIKEPSISLMSYFSKIGIGNREKNLQKPILEFLSLVFLKAEVKGGISVNELKLILDFFESKGMLNIYKKKRIINRSNKKTITDRIAEILKDKEKFKNSIRKYIKDEHMVKTIGEIITHYESRCENE